MACAFEQLSPDELALACQRARRDRGLVVLEGLHALKHALRFGAVVEGAWTADAAALTALAERLCPDLLAKLGALVRPVPAALFGQLAPQPIATGVLAIARRPGLDLAPLLARIDGPPLLLLDQPSHPGNLGAVVRVAAAAGAAGVLTLGGQDPWQPAALRGGAGLQFALPVQMLASLPESPRPLVALDPAGAPLAPGSIPDGAILALGSERQGLRPELLGRATLRLAIPMTAAVSSLNLATAAAIALYSWRFAQQ